MGWEHEHYEHYGHVFEHGHGWGPTLPLMMLEVVFLIALFTILAWAMMQWATARTRSKEWNTSDLPPGLPSLEILRQRYARGEIDAATFEQMRERLEASYRQDHPGRPELLKEDRPTRWVE
jgi:uncharacterized membrane protein